jgi:hypothetical protein
MCSAEIRCEARDKNFVEDAYLKRRFVGGEGDEVPSESNEADRFLL